MIKFWYSALELGEVWRLAFSPIRQAYFAYFVYIP
jgi:hypothetical protein